MSSKDNSALMCSMAFVVAVAFILWYNSNKEGYEEVEVPSCDQITDPYWKYYCNGARGL